MSNDGVLERLDASSGALARGDRVRARMGLLLAAQALLCAARSASPMVREEQCRQARRLLVHADTLAGESGVEIRATHSNSSSAASIDAPELPKALGRTSVPALRLEDIAGAHEVKRTFRAKFLFPLQDPSRAAAYKQTGKGGLLLYGPPGTGKTMLVRALAGELGAPVFSIKPSDIMSKWVGEAEQRLAALFTEARKSDTALIFVDEIDALTSRRDIDQSGTGSRVLAQLLAELDGFEKHNGKLIFVGATNIPWAIDQALLRPGRFDSLCFVDLPQSEARQKILVECLAGVPVAKDLDLAEIAKSADGYSGAEVFAIASQAAQIAYFEVMDRGIERPVGHADFLQAMEAIPRAASPELMQRYFQFGGKSLH